MEGGSKRECLFHFTRPRTLKQAATCYADRRRATPSCWPPSMLDPQPCQDSLGFRVKVPKLTGC